MCVIFTFNIALFQRNSASDRRQLALATKSGLFRNSASPENRPPVARRHRDRNQSRGRRRRRFSQRRRRSNSSSAATDQWHVGAASVRFRYFVEERAERTEKKHRKLRRRWPIWLRRRTSSCTVLELFFKCSWVNSLKFVCMQNKGLSRFFFL